jgi:hypothetical protein
MYSRAFSPGLIVVDLHFVGNAAPLSPDETEVAEDEAAALIGRRAADGGVEGDAVVRHRRERRIELGVLP